MLESGQDWKIAAITISACVHFLFGRYIMTNKELIYKMFMLAKKSEKNGDFPVGSIITKNGKIISSGYNKREKTNCTLDHAEIIAIKQANKKMKSWRLNDCEMYVTLEPCDMCKSIIKEARINKVYYLFERDPYKKQFSKSVFKKSVFNENDIKALEYLAKIESFFLDKR